MLCIVFVSVWVIMLNLKPIHGSKPRTSAAAPKLWVTILLGLWLFPEGVMGLGRINTDKSSIPGSPLVLLMTSRLMSMSRDKKKKKKVWELVVLLIRNILLKYSILHLFHWRFPNINNLECLQLINMTENMLTWLSNTIHTRPFAHALYCTLFKRPTCETHV